VRDINLIVVHCSASPPSVHVDRDVIDRWHREKGWLGIGYHYVITREGDVQVGRALDRPGAHAEGFNKSSIGICLAGGVDAKGKAEDNFTPAQKASMLTLLYQLRALYPATAVLGHRDLPDVKKDCPSFDVRRWCRAHGFAPGMNA